jgi:hypothetical protein
MGLDVPEPGVDGTADAPLRRVVAGELLPPEHLQLAVVALEQPPVQVELG